MISLACLLHRVARAYHSALGHGTARAYLTAREARFLFVCYTTSLFCAPCVARALLRQFYTLKFIVVFLFLFCFFAGEELEEKQLLFLCLYTNLSRLPSIERCHQKSDKRSQSFPFRQHSWACMVSFPRRRGNKNAHLMHRKGKMRDKRYRMVKWHTSRKTRG